MTMTVITTNQNLKEIGDDCCHNTEADYERSPAILLCNMSKRNNDYIKKI